MRNFVAFSLIAAFAHCCSGQSKANSRPAIKDIRTTDVPLAALARGMMPVLNGAYSADETSEFVQPLPNGSKNTRSTFIRRIYRDSRGRTRAERPIDGRSPATSRYPFVVEIQDPVAGVAYALDMQAKVAYRAAIQPRPSVEAGVKYSNPPRPGEFPNTRNDGGIPTRNEFLGFRTIEGVKVRGIRATATFPVGKYASGGNDRPVTTTTEIWTSTELDVTVLFKGDTPAGMTTQRLSNISRREPDASLFRPPSGFRIVDAKGENIPIRYTAQN